jgi:hypothetical protein
MKNQGATETYVNAIEFCLQWIKLKKIKWKNRVEASAIKWGIYGDFFNWLHVFKF